MKSVEEEEEEEEEQKTSAKEMTKEEGKISWGHHH